MSGVIPGDGERFVFFSIPSLLSKFVIFVTLFSNTVKFFLNEILGGNVHELTEERWELNEFVYGEEVFVKNSAIYFSKIL
jgi:hypothetical protein